ncbi:MAG: hypothetical protein ABIX01_09640 [Chitinophagaceae bacterium]
MKKEEKKLFWFGLLALAGTLLVSFVPTRFHIFSYGFREVDFVSDIKKPSAPGDQPSIVKDSTPVLVDTTKPDFLAYKDIINYQYGNNQPIEKFIRALRQLKLGKRKTVRIAYFGDSFIEGDMLTMDLRSLLQTNFGGEGVGFVPFMSVGAGIRQSITHTFSHNWDDLNFKGEGDKSRVFISGHNYAAQQNANVSYRVPDRLMPGTFKKVYLLHQSPEGAHVSINDSSVQLPAAAVVTKTLVDTAVDHLRASFYPGNSTFYGFSFESDAGVILDNFSFRGISGTEYEKFSTGYLSEINEVTPYDLIVFQFGPNLLFNPDMTNFKYYEKPIAKAFQQFNSAFPQADILLVSTGDKAFRYDGSYKTAKGVIPLLNNQQQIAVASGVNFWNLFLNMGGENSMVTWVEGSPKMANVDYTHVNWKGGKKIAEMLYNTIMHAYQTNRQ